MADKPTELTRRFRLRFWFVLAAVTGLRLAVAGTAGLGVDESHYLLFSRHPAWGYFDHPPLVILAALPARLLVESPFTARLGPILLAAATLALWRAWALRMGREEAGIWRGALILHLLPIYHLLSLALMPDAPLNLFWCLALYSAWRATGEGRWRWWLAAGAAGGLAALSKYHGALLIPCLAGYLAASRKNRFWLARPQPYLAALTAAAIFLPNILWNQSHDWISYRFQLGHGLGGRWSPSIGNVLEMVGGQLGAASPLVFVFLIAGWAVLAGKRDKSESDRFLLWTSLPVFAFFALTSAGGKILPHWTFVGWWAGALAAGEVFRERLLCSRRAGGWRKLWRWGAGVALALIAAMYLTMVFPVIRPVYRAARSVSLAVNRRFPAIEPLGPYRNKYDITNDLYGWPEAGAKTEQIRARTERPEKTFVFAHRPFTASQLALYLEPGTAITTLNPRPDQYRLWFDADAHRGWDAIFIDHDRYWQGFDRYLRLFESGDSEPVEFTVYRGGHPAHRFRVYRYFNFKGRPEGIRR